VGQSGMATDIDPNIRIAIKRINKALWKTDRYYVIMDTAEEVSICELLPGDTDKTVRFVTPNAPESSYKVFPVDEIQAIFSIVAGDGIPLPKKKRWSSSNAQKPDLPSDDPLPK
jgi:hypothetical protein